MWCRTRRRRRSPPTRWMRWPNSPTHVTGIPTTTRQAACRPLPRSSFPLAPTAAVLASASFCALTFHQGRVRRCAATTRSCARPSCSRATPSLRATSTTWADRRPTLAALPVTSSSSTACARTSAVCGRACARTWSVDESGYTQLLRDLRQLPGVKKVFVRSGIRFDYTMADASDEFLRELLEHHVSGQLRVAPEHVSDACCP